MEEELLIGDWIREKVLGSGSFGVVSLWRNLKTNEDLAIKMCKWADDIQLTPKHKERWSKEVEMMEIIQNDNIVGTRLIPKELESGLIPTNISKLPILCMEYCSKGDLRQVLNLPDNSNGLPESDIRCILRDMKNAISYLHKLRITHRDLKPENIVLQVATNNSENTHNIIYKLIDLGYAKEIDSDSVCASFVGTLQYLAPELLYSKTYSNTVDYWSFGLVAFEIINGVRPFLPNLPPVQWMQYVKKKTPENICVYESLKGEVEYSDSIFAETYISRCFKGLMEKWLKISLEWDPKKRGHNIEDRCVKFTLPGDKVLEQKVPEVPKESSLVIFTLLENILSKKILTLFSVVTYEHLSYEIDDNTLFETVQGWIERDTKVPINKQVFITNSQQAVDVQSFAHVHWNSNLQVMLYFYQSDSLVNDNVKPKVPSKLRYCLENPRLKLSFTLLLGIFTNSLYFIRTEKELYESLIKAYILRIEHLKIEVKKIFQSHNESDKWMCRLIEKNNLLSSILEINDKNLNVNNQEFSMFSNEYKLLLERCKVIQSKVLKLKDAWTQLTIRLQSTARRCNEIDDKEIRSRFKTNNFTELEKTAYGLVSQVRKISREERGTPKPCLDAVKIIYKCLKLRDVLLHNVQAQQIIQKILDIHVETEKISQLIVSAGQNAEELSTWLTNIILEKESMMLRLINDRSSMMNVDPNTLPSTLNNVENHSQNSIDFKIGQPVRSLHSMSQNVSKEKTNLESLINDNLSLQIATKNFLQKYNEKHQSMKDSLVLDFGFLNEV